MARAKDDSLSCRRHDNSPVSPLSQHTSVPSATLSRWADGQYTTRRLCIVTESAVSYSSTQTRSLFVLTRRQQTDVAQTSHSLRYSVSVFQYNGKEHISHCEETMYNTYWWLSFDNSSFHRILSREVEMLNNLCFHAFCPKPNDLAVGLRNLISGRLLYYHANNRRANDITRYYWLLQCCHLQASSPGDTTAMCARCF